MLAKQTAYELADQNRSNWIEIREGIMLNALRAKFQQHPDLSNKLRSTGKRYLVEFTDRDEYWGDPGDRSGKNRLGHLLMQVRAEVVKQLNKPVLID